MRMVKWTMYIYMYIYTLSDQTKPQPSKTAKFNTVQESNGFADKFIPNNVAKKKKKLHRQISWKFK